MNNILPKSLPAVLVALSSVVTSCVYVPMPPGMPTKYVGPTFARPGSNAAPDHVSYWNGDGVSGSPSIRISLSTQRAFFYKSGKLVGVSAISSGREGLGTVTGHFNIQEKDRNHKSSLFGDYVDDYGNVVKKEIDTSKDPRPKGAHFDGAKMPFFMRVTGGTGMHEGYLPGYPASHGCIRMPARMAEAFYNNVSVGTPVTITN